MKFYILTPSPKRKLKFWGSFYGLEKISIHETLNMDDFISKYPLFEKLHNWKLDVYYRQIDPTNPNILLVFTTEVDLPLILRMRSGNNHVNRQFQAKTPKSNNSKL